MKITHELTYNGPIESVLEVLASEELAAKRASKLGVSDYSLTKSADGGAEVTTLNVKVPPTKLPSMAQKFLSKGIDADIIATVTRVAPGANVKLDVTPRTSIPGKGSARMVLEDAGEVTRAKVEADVNVSIPFVGGRIEKEATKHFPALLDQDARAVNEILASR